MSSITAPAKRNAVAYAVIGLFVALCAVGWAIIVAHTEGTPGISPAIVSWQAADRSVRVHYQIGKPKPDRVRCAIVAYDLYHAEVGRVSVAVPAGVSSVERHQDVPTRSHATAVDVRDCHAG